MANYNVFRNDRGDARGGSTAIFVKNNIVRNVWDVDKLVYLEATVVEVVIATAGVIRLVSICCPPNLLLLYSDLELVLHLHYPTILAGVLNAKHQSWNNAR